MQRNKAATLERVLQSSVQEFAKKGFHLARVSDIANLARCSTETIYDVYVSKEGLFNAVVDHVMAVNFEQVDIPTLFAQELKGVDCPVAAVCRMGALFGRPLVDETFHALYWQLHASGADARERVVSATYRRRLAYDAELAKLMQEAQREELVATGDPTSAAHLVLSTVGSIEVAHQILHQETVCGQRVFDSVKRAVGAFATPAGRTRLDALTFTGF